MFWRAQGATAYIVDGTAVTCLQDSVIICAKHVGIELTKGQMYADMVHPEKYNGKELEVGEMITYMREKVSPTYLYPFAYWLHLLCELTYLLVAGRLHLPVHLARPCMGHSRSVPPDWWAGVRPLAVSQGVVRGHHPREPC